MVGIIVTGHGHFASGLTSSIDLIAGPQKNYFAIDFDQEVVQLEEALNNAYNELCKTCEGIIVFADLVGGAPFKTAVMVSQNYENIEVIGGTNLPMLCEIVLARGMGMDLESLASVAINIGKDGISRFDMASIIPQEEIEDFTDGI